MTRYTWARWGDINAFFGLMLDNVAVMIVLVVLVTSAEPVAEQRFSREFVLTQMIPGTALGVVLGDLTYTWMAFRLARRTGRSDVTAMPLGLDTPSTFAVGALVLLPALNDGSVRYGLDHAQAMVFSWHVAAIVLLIVGVFKSVLAPLGGKVRRWVPRAGLLGSLAAIALPQHVLAQMPQEAAIRCQSPYHWAAAYALAALLLILLHLWGKGDRSIFRPTVCQEDTSFRRKMDQSPSIAPQSPTSQSKDGLP